MTTDDFEVRLHRELRALADAVPTGQTSEVGTASDSLVGRQAVRARVRVRQGSPFGRSAAALALVAAVIVGGAAVFGGWINSRPGIASAPSGSAGISTPGGSASTSLNGLTAVQPHVVMSFGSDELTATVLGADGAAYVLDDSVGTVYRVDLRTGAKLPILSLNQAPASGGGTVGRPRLLAVGGGDVLVLDDVNGLWRWRSAPGDQTGRGSLMQVNIPDALDWGSGVRSISTFVVNADQNLYGLYVVVPTPKLLLKYMPAPDGSGFPLGGAGTGYFTGDLAASSVDDMYTDGMVYLAAGGKITRYESGLRVSDWTPAAAGGPTPYYTRLAADNSAQNQGTLYAFDRAGRRVVAFSKKDGALVQQYTVPADSHSFSAITGMFVVAGSAGAGPTLYWTESGNLMRAELGSSALPTAAPTAASFHGRFTTAGSTGQSNTLATLLNDGRVLILGDTSAELYDPGTAAVSPAGTSPSSQWRTATTLKDGRVLVTLSADVPNSPAAAEIYDPSSGTFSPTGSMVAVQWGSTATLLQDGRVLFAGGFSVADTGDSSVVTTAEVYDPASGKFSLTGSMFAPRSMHAATLLPDGRVLITGGYPETRAEPGYSDTATAELYDPKTGTFSQTGSMVQRRTNHTSTLLSDGRVLVAGGGFEGDAPTATAELYDPKSGSFSATGPMGTARMAPNAVLLLDGRVLIFSGGDDNGTLYASAEAYDPASGTFTATGSMNERRYGGSAVLLSDGRVLVIGGGPTTAELYQP